MAAPEAFSPSSGTPLDGGATGTPGTNVPDLAGWQTDNQLGLALSGEGAWNDAARAFSSAAASLGAQQDHDPSAHEGLALVLSNLAQACYRDGRTDVAIQHAQRSLAIRVTVCGEDAVATARSRSDLAVLLASAGHAEEAQALVARAITSVEQRAGEEDAALLPLLENAARISLALAQPASAEPQLLRLHALLSAHGESTDLAEALLTRVLEARQVADVQAQIEGATATTDSSVSKAQDDDADSVFDDVLHQETAEAVAAGLEQALAEPLPVSPLVDDAQEWEDQPLRDAVLLTDALLRTTPSGVPVIRAEPDAPVVIAPTAAEEAVAEPVPEPVAPSVAEPVATPAAAPVAETVSEPVDSLNEDVFADETFRDELLEAGDLEFTDTLGNPMEADSPPPIEEPRQESGLGFEVSYGIPLEPEQPPAMARPAPMTPQVKPPAPVPAEPELEFVPQASLAPDVSTSVTQEFSLNAPPSSRPVALQPVIPRADRVPENHPPARPTVANINAVPMEEPRRKVPTPRIAGAKPAPAKSHGLLIGGGVGAIIVAIAGWYFTRGMF
jgi:hypothetical protein